MSALQAIPHDSSPISTITAGSDNPHGPLVLSEEEFKLLDPLEQLAAKMMIRNGKAILLKGVG